jgi:hypothetical protein
MAAATGACTGANLPILPLLPSSSEAGGAAAQAESQTGPHETSVVVPGTPTTVFAAVARGALGCWFGANGPLKASHVYRAEAEPPAKGGAAEITVYEREKVPSQRDQRGPRAYHVAFASELSGVRVAATAHKFAPALAQAMARDVEAWAKGGTSCQLRTAVTPRPAVAAAKPPGKAARPASKAVTGKQAAAPAAKKKPAPAGKQR